MILELKERPGDGDTDLGVSIDIYSIRWKL